MWNSEPPQEFTDTIFKFFESSVSKIHKTQNYDTYIQWVKENHSDFFPANDDSLQVAIAMARTVWNATPLSSNRYRPSPLSEVKRNSPCPCGSGKKYKQCCLHISDMFPPMDSNLVWAFLLDEMNQQEVEEALSLHILPVGFMLEIADQYIEDEKTIEAIQILEPIFTTSAEKMGEDECYALTKLCNAYDDIGLPEFQTRKMELLHQLKDKGSRLIRSEAWQRLSVITIDQGNKDAAWKAFQHAQRLTPNNPGVDLLEINLLIGESKTDLAQQRAKIIIRKMQRNGSYEDSPFSEFLQAVAEDPQAVIDELYHYQDSYYPLDRLQEWLEKVAGRRLPIYKTDPFTADYSWMDQDDKIPPLQPNLLAEPESENNIFNKLPDKEHRLITPTSINKLDKRWAELIYDREQSFLWDKDEDGWIEFLEKNPQCFGSVEIIDDILTALEGWKQEKDILENISLPLAQRAWQIYESLPEQGGMPWGFFENRSLYSALSSIIDILKNLDQKDEAISYTERLILINPNDNLGLRGRLANDYLSQKAYNKIFNLLQLYPNDISLDMSMAKTLTLWAMGDIEGAKKQWLKAKKYNSHIKKYMLKSKIAMPELTYGVTMGGEDEAWLYRDVARDIWLDHKGALSWLKQN